MKRGLVVIEKDDGTSTSTYVEEVTELAKFVEDGPDWNDVKRIVLTYQRKVKS